MQHLPHDLNRKVFKAAMASLYRNWIEVIKKSYMCKWFWVCVCECEYSSSILGQLLLKARMYANESQIPKTCRAWWHHHPQLMRPRRSYTHKIILICKFYSVCVNGKMKTVELIKGTLMFLEFMTARSLVALARCSFNSDALGSKYLMV